jgi:hypothetical protein
VPSEPVTTTLRALVALMVKVDVLPALIEVGEATMLIVAACGALF